MDEDKAALAEKIVKDIDNVMRKNAELCSFEIVPVEANFQNKSPVLHVENCLGLESWCVKHVYLYCYTEIMDKIFSKKNRTPRMNSIISDRLIRLLNVTLLLNPDVSTLWNRRRQIVSQSTCNMTAELQFTKLVLSRKPKCNDAFSYRRWILDYILQDTQNNHNINEFIFQDLEVCNIASEKSPNNYHSWNHRIWLINKLKAQKHLPINLHNIFITEYEFSENWILKHVSDFSCYHYRQFCIKILFTFSNEHWKSFVNSISTNLRQGFIRFWAANCPEIAIFKCPEDDLDKKTEEFMVSMLFGTTRKYCNCRPNYVSVIRKLEVLFNELVLNNGLLTFYKYHETLWYHRRFIIHEILEIMYDNFSLVRQHGTLTRSNCVKCVSVKPKIGKYDSDAVYSTVLFDMIKLHEKKFIEDRRNDSDNYADRHERYLKLVEGLKDVM